MRGREKKGMGRRRIVKKRMSLPLRLVCYRITITEEEFEITLGPILFNRVFNRVKFVTI